VFILIILLTYDAEEGYFTARVMVTHVLHCIVEIQEHKVSFFRGPADLTRLEREGHWKKSIRLTTCFPLNIHCIDVLFIAVVIIRKPPGWPKPTTVSGAFLTEVRGVTVTVES
jgi:hypothetical protein